jgi:hypothetical protein
MSKMTRLIVVLLIVRAAAGQFFIEPGQAPPPPEPEPLASYSYEPLGWDVVPPGLRVRVSDDGLRVRAEPRLSAAVLEQLNTGDEVVIQSVGPREIIADRGAWWYEVAALDGGPILGWVYGGFLQPSQSGDWRDTLRSALGLVHEGDPAAAHELLAGLPEDTPLTPLTEPRQPALAVLYNLALGDDGWWPVYLIAGPEYGICLVTDSSGDGFHRVYDDRWLVWDSGTWVFGPQFFCDLTTGVVDSAIEPTSRSARHLADGRFLLLIHRRTDDQAWVNAYAGTDADGYRSGVALYDGAAFTLLLPEQRWYSWREIHGADRDAAGCYFTVGALPNLDPSTLEPGGEAREVAGEGWREALLFRVRFDPEAGRVTGIEPLPSAAD